MTNKDFTANSPKLWQQALAVMAKTFPATKHNDWEARSHTVNWYWDHGGRFINTLLPSQLVDTKQASIIKNILATNGIEINASLMARSLQHQWREYLGHTDLVINPPNDGSGSPVIIKPNGFFGMKPKTGGYDILLPNAQNTTFTVPHLTGYSLLTLSRELSLREMKFRD